MKDYYKKYIKNINEKIHYFDENKGRILESKIIETKKKDKKIVFLGNGGSNAICNHFSVDFNKNLQIITKTFDESIITCFSNDFGHENWMKKALEFNLNKNDLVVFVSSSGSSKNHLNAANFCKKNNFYTISFTGFKKNKLSKITNLSFIVESNNYNIIENTHSVWMLMILDKIKKFKI